MEIVKKLNLNKTPQAVDNNSIVFAKNIKLSNDGQYLTNEESLVGIASVLNTGEIIVGVIPTSTELVVFKYNESTDKSYILRVKEKEEGVDIVTVPNTWNYSGGKINGTYTYNVKNELIIAIGESGKHGDVPLKTINLDTSTNIDSKDLYNVAPSTPICNCKLNNLISGISIPNGIYHLFIRYEISNDTYTKWFPIGAPYYAINLQSDTIINHWYPTAGASGGYRTVANATYNNTTTDVPYNFELNLIFNNSNNFSNYQIGYILQHDTTQVARLWKKFELNGKSNDTIIFNTDGAKEYSIEELVEDSYNIYNVENICNYGNRLYISNYEETKTNVNVEANLSAIKVKYNVDGGEVANAASATFSGIKNGITYTESFTVTSVNSRLQTISFMTWFNNFGYTFSTKRKPLSDGNYFKHPTLGYIRFTSVVVEIDSDLNTFSLTHDNLYTFSKTDKIYEYIDGVISEFDTYDFSAIVVSNINIDNRDIVGEYTAYINKRTLIPNQVYNFFIHYVKSDGSHTRGIRIPNNTSDRIYTFKGTTTNSTYGVTTSLSAVSLPDGSSNWLKTLLQQSTVKSLRICDVFNNYNSVNSYFGYYENSNGESMFKAPDVGSPKTKIGIEFSGITIPSEYIGCFISYEKVEKIVQYTSYTASIDRQVATDVQIGLNTYSGAFIKKVFKQSYDSSYSNDRTYITSAEDGSIYAVTSVKPIAANTVSDLAFNNEGRGPNIYLLTTGVPDLGGGQINRTDAFNAAIVQMFIANKYLYTNKTKELVKLGGVLYKPEGGVISNGMYSEKTINSDFAYPGYITLDRVVHYDTNGVIINDDGSAVDVAQKAYSGTSNDKNNGIARYAGMISFFKHCDYQLLAMSIKKKPDILVATVNNITRSNIVVRALNALDLIEYKSEYIPAYVKAFANYDSTNKEINKYSKTIRRSDVIRTESTENSWRYFRPDAYKIISENKGNITNIVGIGLYLLVHTEHSLFMFNRDASMKTQDKDVQLYIPDAFDTEYQEVFTSDKGYGGLQDPYSWVLNEHGYTFYDNDAKQLYSFDNGKLDIISNDVIQLIRAFDIQRVRLVIDKSNNRLLICFKIKDARYFTLSFNYLVVGYISLHDYYFDEAWNTKSNCYLLGTKIGVNNGNNKLYTFKDSTTIGIYQELQLKDNSIFPTYSNDDGDICYSVIDIIFNINYETIKSLDFINYILTEILEYSSYVNQAEEQVNRRYSGHQLYLYSDCCKSKLLDINVGNTANKFNNYKYPFYEKGRWNLNYFRNYIERSKADEQSLIYGKYIVASFIFNNDSQKRIKLENINFGVNRY